MRTSSRHAPAHPGPSGEQSGKGSGGSRAAARLDALERLAEPVVRASGMDLEEVQLVPAGRRRLLRVVVDAPGGVCLDDMALVSQALSAELDTAGIMGDTQYTLEVTSPGVDRPLTQPRHWRHSVGRMVRVPLTGQGRSGGRAGRPAGRGDHSAASAAQVVFGRVMAADDDGVFVDIDGQQRRFGFAELGPGKVQVEFSRDDMGESRGH